MESDITKIVGGCFAFAALVSLVLCAGVFSSYMEAQAYNRATGKHVSTWDAMWIDLRVQSEAKD